MYLDGAPVSRNRIGNIVFAKHIVEKCIKYTLRIFRWCARSKFKVRLKRTACILIPVHVNTIPNTTITNRISKFYRLKFIFNVELTENFLCELFTRELFMRIYTCLSTPEFSNHWKIVESIGKPIADKKSPISKKYTNKENVKLSK